MVLSTEEQIELLSPNISPMDYVQIDRNAYKNCIAEITPWINKKVEIYQRREVHNTMGDCGYEIWDAFSTDDRDSLEIINENIEYLVKKYFGERIKRGLIDGKS